MVFRDGFLSNKCSAAVRLFSIFCPNSVGDTKFAQNFNAGRTGESSKNSGSFCTANGRTEFTGWRVKENFDFNVIILFSHACFSQTIDRNPHRTVFRSSTVYRCAYGRRSNSTACPVFPNSRPPSVESAKR